MRLGELASALGAQLIERELADREITEVDSPELAAERALVFAEDATTSASAARSRAGALLTTPPLAAERAAAGPALMTHAQPRLAFARAARLLRPATPVEGIHPLAQVAPSALIGERVTIQACAFVGDGVRVGAGSAILAGAVVGAGAVIGADCVIHARAVLYAGVSLGDRVVVHAGAVLGADGFGYVRDPESGAYVQFPQQGTLVIEDDVDIGANTTIDRGALGETRIGRGTKLDNLVHVGHNVRIGADVVIAAQTGISGSSTIGDGAVIAGQVGIGDHAGVGPGVILGGQAGVLPHKTLLGPGLLFWGTPAKPVKQYLRELARLTRLGRGA